jgi:hypothetical protein
MRYFIIQVNSSMQFNMIFPVPRSLVECPLVLERTAQIAARLTDSRLLVGLATNSK